MAGTWPFGSRVVRTMTLAHDLVTEAVDDDDALRMLRQVPGGTATLRRCLRVIGSSDDYPLGRMRALLSAATTGSAPPPLTETERRVHAELRLLQRLAPDDAFARLAASAPALRDLHAGLAEGTLQLDDAVPATPRPSDQQRADRAAHPGGAAGGARTADRRRLRRLHALLSAIVGPDSGSTDPVFASSTAHSVAMVHLADVAGIDMHAAALGPNRPVDDHDARLLDAWARRWREVLPAEAFLVEVEGAALHLDRRGPTAGPGLVLGVGPGCVSLPIPTRYRLETQFFNHARAVQELVCRTSGEPWPAPGASPAVRVTREQIIVSFKVRSKTVLALRPFSRPELDR